MSIREFHGKKANVRLNDCIKMYLSVNHKLIYKNGRPTVDYYRVRAYLKKLPEQTITNIWLYLQEHKEENLYDLERLSAEFVRQKQIEEEAKTQTQLNTGNHEYDLEAFLNG